MEELFKPFGRIADRYLSKDRVTGECKGYAFVHYYKKEDLLNAIRTLNGLMYNGVQMKVRRAENEDSEDEECPMEREVREKFSEDQEEYESMDAEEDKPKRRLGRRQEQDGSGDEGPYLAKYFHTCGNCKVENQANIFTHLDNNNACA